MLKRPRSRKYLWKIGTHRHTLLSPCVLVTSGTVAVTLDSRTPPISRASFAVIAVSVRLNFDAATMADKYQVRGQSCNGA